MNAPSAVSISDMPAANRSGSERTREERHVVRRDAGGDREQADLGRGVEAEPEEHAERVHLPASRIRSRPGR